MVECHKIMFQLKLLSCLLSLALSVDVNPTKPRQCYSCEGINCQRITKQNYTTNCTDLLDICVTIFEEYTVVAKGCYLDMPDHHREKCDIGNNPECFKCFGQLCNNKGRADFKCIECNDNVKCASETSAMAPVQCPIPSAPNSYCYIRNFGGNKVQRGCYVHVLEQVNCMQDASCSMCLSNDDEACNSYKISTTPTPSKASQNVINFAVMFMTMIQLIGFFR